MDKAITVPLQCPECESTEVMEVATAVAVDEFYKWDETKKKYVFEYDDSENFGDLYLACGECNYRYNQTEYDAFAMSNPITRGEIN